VYLPIDIFVGVLLSKLVDPLLALPGSRKVRVISVERAIRLSDGGDQFAVAVCLQHGLISRRAVDRDEREPRGPAGPRSPDGGQTIRQQFLPTLKLRNLRRVQTAMS